MNDIDIRLLQGAITLAEELNMSRAAARLGITQPALTKRMHDLEQRLGVVLFERTNRGVELTDHCRAFIQDARLALVHLNRAIQRARESAEKVEDVLRIGRSPYVDPYIVSVLTSIRLALYPGLSLDLSANFSAVLSQQVIASELDLALIAKGTESPLLNYVKVESSPFFVLFKETDDLAALSALKMSNLNARPWALFGRHVHPYLHDQLLFAAKEALVSPSRTRTIQTAEEAAQFVVESSGVAFLTQMGAWRNMEPGLTIRPLLEDNLRVDTVLITRVNDESRLLSEYVRSAMKKLARVGPASRPLPLVS